MQPRPEFTYKATCHRIIDGDTFVADIDVGFHTIRREPLRLRGWNAAELDQQIGPSAKLLLGALLYGENGIPEPLLVRTEKTRSVTYKRSFARYIADVWISAGPDSDDVERWVHILDFLVGSSDIGELKGS